MEVNVFKTSLLIHPAIEVGAKVKNYLVCFDINISLQKARTNLFCLDRKIKYNIFSVFP